MRSEPSRRLMICSLCLAVVLSAASVLSTTALADGKVVRPRDYQGSLEEQSQEAIIVFHQGDEMGEAVEHLILKIRVAGDTDNFAWVVPFPAKPKVEKESAKLFEELFRYVEARRVGQRGYRGDAKSDGGAERAPASPAVKVLSREVVGSYDVAVVEETERGALNLWLEENGYQKLDDAEDVLNYYRKLGYVFACIKVDEAQKKNDAKAVELHPLRFTFKTGGRDGIYYPMKLTGLQSEPFDVNLYVFYKAWLNDDLNGFGYEHRGFDLRFRDYDSPQCVPNAGKAYSLPQDDVYLKNHAKKLREVQRFFQKISPGARYYLTNVYARNLQPEEVREWSGDLWLFPYYIDRSMIPYDARSGHGGTATGPAAHLYDHLDTTTSVPTPDEDGSAWGFYFFLAIMLSLLGLIVGGFFYARRKGWIAGGGRPRV